MRVPERRRDACPGSARQHPCACSSSNTSPNSSSNPHQLIRYWGLMLATGGHPISQHVPSSKRNAVCSCIVGVFADVIWKAISQIGCGLYCAFTRCMCDLNIQTTLVRLLQGDTSHKPSHNFTHSSCTDRLSVVTPQHFQLVFGSLWLAELLHTHGTILCADIFIPNHISSLLLTTAGSEVQPQP